MGTDGALRRCPEEFEAGWVLWDGGLDVVAVPDDVFPRLADPGLGLCLRHDAADESDTVALQIALEGNDFFWVVYVGVVDGGYEVYASGLDVINLGLERDQETSPGRLNGGLFAVEKALLDVCESGGQRDGFCAVKGPHWRVHGSDFGKDAATAYAPRRLGDAVL